MAKIVFPISGSCVPQKSYQEPYNLFRKYFHQICMRELIILGLCSEFVKN